MLAELARRLADNDPGAGGVRDLPPEDPRDPVAADRGDTGGVAAHWLRAGLAVIAVLVVTAALSIYVNFVAAAIGGGVLMGVVLNVAIRRGHRRGRPDKAVDIPLGLSAVAAMFSMAFFAPVFYLSAVGKEGVTKSVLVTHGSRNSASCRAVLPNDRTARIPCYGDADKNSVSDGHHRVVYDPHGRTWAYRGTKAGLPVPLGAGLVLGCLVVFVGVVGVSAVRTARAVRAAPTPARPRPA